MAGKKVQKKVSQKEIKKNGRRLKRSVRKTFGALFLATAIAVAAIPTDNLQVQAAEEKTKLTWDKEIGNDSTIPLVPEECETIYTNEDGRYIFAWVQNSATDKNMIAVILKYNGGTLTNNELVIPDTVDAYIKFSENEGTGTGYVAVSQSQKPLYYRVVVREEVKDEEGRVVTPAEYAYKPCYAESKERGDRWGYVNGAERNLSDFYYWDDVEEDYKQTTDPTQQWIRHVTVAYIGNQSLQPYTGETEEDEKDSDGIQREWKVDSGEYNKDTPSKGIFANQGNIRYLTVGPNLIGVGNYAFYNCTGLEGITLGNGIQEIGHHAFSNCTHLTSVDFGERNNLAYISDYAFQNCTRLTEYSLTPSVTKIFDHAFDGCTLLEKVNLEDVQDIGYYVFKNCGALSNLQMPNTLTPDDGVHLNNFAGCYSLKWIKVVNSATNFVADEEKQDEGEEDESETKDGYSVGDFKGDVDSEFYFEGRSISSIHDFTGKNAIAFRYYEEDRYEIIIVEKGTAGEDVLLTYEVNLDGDLLQFNMGAPVEEVTIPAKIGPSGVKTIDSGSFGGGAGSCFLRKITIPGTVTAINAEAFKGCHNLKSVFFSDASTIENIDASAFATQAMEGAHHDGCENKDYNDPNSEQFVSNPELVFVGEVGTGIVPFDYAMQANSNINVGEQNRSYITYCSGWPRNMEIRFNSTKGMSELVCIPSLNDLLGGNYGDYTADASYITDAQKEAASRAVMKYNESGKSNMSEDELQIIDAVVNIVIPEGVQSVKNGLFQEKESDDSSLLKEKKTVTAYSLKQITCVEEGSQTEKDSDAKVTGTFAGCSGISSITLLGGVESLDSHAFMNCTGLTEVVLPDTLTKMGTRPFAGCSQLSNVSFTEGEKDEEGEEGKDNYFDCVNGIIYEYDLKNDTKAIVECLESRSNPIVDANTDDIADVSKVYPEAFMGTRVLEVDFSQTDVTTIPERTFMNTATLMSMKLPNKEPITISKDAFRNSSIIRLTIPGKMHTINSEAFSGTTIKDNIWFACEEDSMARQYADEYGIHWSETPPEIYHTVVFGYYDEENVFQPIGDPQTILDGQPATPPADSEVPERTGYQFTGVWLPTDYLAVYKDGLQIAAQYIPESDVFYTITYWYDYATEYTTQRVQKGFDAFVINDPVKEGYIFKGWVVFGGEHSGEEPVWTNIQADMTVIAVFELDSNTDTPSTSDSPDPGVSGSPDPGTSGSPSPGMSSDPGASSSPGASSDPGTSSSPDPSASGSPGADSTLYTLTVQNGSGSGSYAEGAQPIIIANDPATGQVFDYWSVSPTDVKIASLVLSASIITMPAGDVTVTAHYKAGSGNGTSGSGTTGSSNNTRRPSTGTVTSGGTTVVIDKNGLSNTGVVSATVNGSSDNFTIKVTESSSATEAALRALMAEYGSLDNIRYFPMDITLYDSTGNNKITDTTGLSVTVTLPLPDSMITYAGNNRVASVSNDRLERLSARFSTIQGVSCITFTAEHFSPYVIYVDLGNLSSGYVSDDTPKTGDPIHPKWFLSIGLACLSFVFFMQKDTRKPKKAKVKVKAKA